MPLRREEGWRRRTPLSWLATAPQSSPSLCCTVKVYHPLCHCALLLCHASSIKRCSRPTCSLAGSWVCIMLGLGSLCRLGYPRVGGAAGHCAGAWSGCWVSPSHQSPAGQALLLLLHPSVTVIHFCEPAKAELLLSWGHWRCNSRSEDSPWQPYHGLDFPTSFN